MIPSRGLIRPCVMLLMLCSVFLLTSQLHAERPRIYAITGVDVVQAPGRTVEDATVVLRDGLIEAVGKDIAVPADAEVITGEEGWVVYAAFIDAASSVGLDTQPSGGRPGGRPRGGEPQSMPGSPHELKAVHPEQAVVDRLDAGHSSFERHRELGFAVAHVLPPSGVFRGQSAVVLVREGPASERVLKDRLAQVIAFEKSSFMARQYPSSTIGAIAAVRQTLLDAQRQKTWNERYAKDPRGMPHPEFRSSDAALAKLLAGDEPAVFVSLAGLDPLRFHGIASQFRLRAMTVARGLGDRPEYLVDAGMPVLLPLEMPEKPDLKDPEAALDVSLDEMQAVVRAPHLPAMLNEAGVEFAFVTAGMKSPRNFPENLAAVVDGGLSPDSALAALTTVPAKLLGMDQTIGRIEPGMQANLLVVQGELFTDKPAFRHVFIDGYHEEIEPEETIGDPNAVVDPRGRWEIVTEVMGRRGESTWTISGDRDAYKGFSESERSGKRPFSRVDLKGNALTVVSSSPRGEMEITVVIDEDKLSGETEMESPRGSIKMTVEGRRVAGPEGEQQ